MGLSSYGKPFEDRIIGIKRGEFQYYCDEYELRKQYEVVKIILIKLIILTMLRQCKEI